MKKLDQKIELLPRTPGVYIFRENQRILYIGKSSDLKERVKNHFNQPSYKDEMFIGKVNKIEIRKTESEIEALILESRLIKKYKPKFNYVWKDDKNYFYVQISKEKLPRILITHRPNAFGPFVDGKALKKTLVILRKAFPYYTQKKHPRNKCAWCHLNLCPGPDPDIKKYKKDISNLKLILKGKKNSVLRKLKKEMALASKAQEYEKAGEIKNKIYALERIMANAKIINGDAVGKKGNRIEGYDISNIQGKLAVGSMVVFENGKPNKSEYRKFRIKMENEPNDTAMIKEIISRRLRHTEWPLPQIMLIDGGKGQLNAALSALKTMNYESKIKVFALAKKRNELFSPHQKEPALLKNMPKDFSNLILRVRDESHRFAIAYHKKLRELDLGL